MYQDKILVRQLGLQPYEPVSQAMHEFTDTRDENTPDEIGWLSITLFLLRVRPEKQSMC